MKVFNIHIPRSIINITIFAVAMNVLRIVIWDKYSFIYILWNIFLAFVPFVISFFLLSYVKEKKINKTFLIIGMFLWLLFIPNAPYIVTDFIHLGEIRTVPILFDSFLLFSSAALGLILGFYSLFHIEQIIRMKFSNQKTNIIMSLIILLISFGIYLGRFLRFNSWDVFFNHTSLIKNVWKVFSGSSSNLEVYLYTLLFFFFLSLFYEAWKESNSK